MTVLLEADAIRRSFYGVAALNGADLTVEAGTITGLIGPNGAGKTTLFNVISGLVPPQAGRIRLAGEDITGWRPDRIARRGLARTFQIARGFPKLTVFEALLLHGARQPGEGLVATLAGLPWVMKRERALREKAEAIAETLRLTAVLDRPCEAISGGQKKLLELGRALMTEPKLVLLDEPVAGINPTLADELAEHLAKLNAAGLTFLIVEHDLNLIARLCQPVVVMSEGRHLITGRFADVAADPRVQEAYMGRRRWAS
jgi:ABC-type branched-subunit amino acid transport system ATPase component